MLKLCDNRLLNTEVTARGGFNGVKAKVEFGSGAGSFFMCLEKSPCKHLKQTVKQHKIRIICKEAKRMPPICVCVYVCIFNTVTDRLSFNSS